MLNGFISIFILKEDKTESEFALSCLDITLTKLDLEEIKNDSKVFLCFLIVVSINSSIAVILDWAAKILLNDELAPDLYYLLVEILCVNNLTLLFEDLSHVIVAAT